MNDRRLRLLHPFYLDEDMSMAFAAALTGGVEVAREDVERTEELSEAVRSLRGSLRLWRAGAAEASRQGKDGFSAASESRLTRHHTVSSIFIALQDELTSTGQLQVEPDLNAVAPGDLVSLEMGPAVAPLRRVVDQIVRLLNIMAPFVDEDDASEPQLPRQQRRAIARQQAKRRGDEGGDAALTTLRNLFVALQEDLEHSGMIDIVVGREDAPSVVLTLDKRFIQPPTLEQLQTSQFTVIGKVTQTWADEDDLVNLYRRSVLAMVPRLAQTLAWNVWTFLATLSRSLDVQEAEQAAREAVGLPADADDSSAAEVLSRQSAGEAANTTDQPMPDVEQAQERPTEEGSEGDADSDDDVVIFGNDILALNPVVSGPAIQILPLAICS